jgi:hypothetical protein
MIRDRHFDVQVNIRNGAIIVTLRGTQFYARYRKKDRAPWLVATDIRDDPNAPISRFAFHARAWTAANEKARDLGWRPIDRIE